ncbi:glycerate kinase [Acidothermaceae bacterium B102]|nr:glycerate kinase [Acidothermaceae bacterium B102]
MRVLIAPDSFGSTLTAVEAAEAMREGWLLGAPGDDVVLAPLSDGGPGFVDVLASALGGDRVTLTVEDPLARAVEATYLRVSGTAYIESAQACGLHLLTVEERDPLRATTYGVGQLVAHALDAGATRIVVGLGGSATNDGGAGLLAALGVRRLEAAGERAAPGGLALRVVDRLVVDLHPRLAEVELVAATDVINPLLGFKGASAVYGPQKGATPDDTQRLDTALTHWADVLQRDLTGGVDVRALPGAGAAGGMGAALLALGATRVSGIGLVRDALGLAEQVASVGLVVTGEGTYDWQSRDGKVISGVTSLAIENGLPCVLIAGQVVVGRRQTSSSGLDAAYALDEAAGSVQAAMDHAAYWVRTVAESVAREWSIPG